MTRQYVIEINNKDRVIEVKKCYNSHSFLRIYYAVVEPVSKEYYEESIGFMKL